MGQGCDTPHLHQDIIPRPLRGSFLYNKVMEDKSQQIVSGNSMPQRIFSPYPNIKTGKGRIVFSPSQLNKLLDASLAVLDKIPDEDLRRLLQADLRHEFEIFYSRKNLNLTAKDFVIDETAKISTNIVATNVGSN